MEFTVKRLILILSLTAFFAGGNSATAGNPIGDFFKRLGDSIAHPRSTAPAGSSGEHQRQKTDPQLRPRRKTRPPRCRRFHLRQPQRRCAARRFPVVRAAVACLPQEAARDLPYGFHAEQGGICTIPMHPGLAIGCPRFPSGTEVKDPYTGKLFYPVAPRAGNEPAIP